MMHIMNLNKLYYYTWNIGIVERSAKDIIISQDSEVIVHWVKHNYKDRFFADPFILSVDEKEIKVLVEDFPYYGKKGWISILTIDRMTYQLVDKKIILKQPFHLSYPLIQRNHDGSFWVAPEASMSGKLYRYTMNPKTSMLENQELLVNAPLLDSTIIEHDGMYWLFCTKRGNTSNKDLYIYYSDKPEGPWLEHIGNPVVSDSAMARPAGYMLTDGITIYRVAQKCDNTYGEAINVTKIEKLSTAEFKETFVKRLREQNDNFTVGFHTINGLEDICVVDGLKKDFAPFRKIWFELKNRIGF